jgi:AcrR family transcriptional regulator
MSLNEPNEGKCVLKKKARRRRIIELRTQGHTITEIAEELGVGDSTVDRDLKSRDAQEFIDALVQQQLADIISAKIGVRLHYRDKLLEKMMPRKVEQKTEGKLDLTVDKGKDIADLLRKYDCLFVEKRVPSQNSSQQPVDFARAHAETS